MYKLVLRLLSPQDTIQVLICCSLMSESSAKGRFRYENEFSDSIIPCLACTTALICTQWMTDKCRL